MRSEGRRYQEMYAASMKRNGTCSAVVMFASAILSDNTRRSDFDI